jgi:hypothetical protein
MSVEKKKSYSSIVRTFLRKPELSKLYNLDAYQREILRVIANYLDMPFGSCFAKQTVLAEECGMSVPEFKRKSKLLVDKNLLQRTKCRKLYHYELSTLRCLLDT